MVGGIPSSWNMGKEGAHTATSRQEGKTQQPWLHSMDLSKIIYSKHNTFAASPQLQTGAQNVPELSLYHAQGGGVCVREGVCLCVWESLERLMKEITLENSVIFPALDCNQIFHTFGGPDCSWGPSWGFWLTKAMLGSSVCLFLKPMDGWAASEHKSGVFNSPLRYLMPLICVGHVGCRAKSKLQPWHFRNLLVFSMLLLCWVCAAALERHTDFWNCLFRSRFSTEAIKHSWHLHCAVNP